MKLKCNPCGVPSLLSNNTYVSDVLAKANILSSYYQLIYLYWRKKYSKKKAQVPSNNAWHINIDVQGVLTTIDVHKAYGPDNVLPRVLKETAYIIAPLCHLIIQRIVTIRWSTTKLETSKTICPSSRKMIAPHHPTMHYNFTQGFW